MFTLSSKSSVRRTRVLKSIKPAAQHQAKTSLDIVPPALAHSRLHPTTPQSGTVERFLTWLKDGDQTTGESTAEYDVNLSQKTSDVFGRPGNSMMVNRKPVRVKAFCVGQAKSGTASLVGLLSANYRAAHEPERPELLSMILRESRGELSAEAFRRFLLERDVRLNLEYDVSWVNQFVIGHLLNVFPASRFIVLIRDSYSWLQSAIGHVISRELPSEIVNFLPWSIKPERYPHSRQDRALAERGLYSIAAYLHAWNDHINRCTPQISEDRRLMLRTHELARSHRRLADFLEIPLDTLDAGKGHQNSSTWQDGIESLVDPGYIDTMVQSICADNLALHFPEIRSAQDVSRLWEAVPREPAT